MNVHYRVEHEDNSVRARQIAHWGVALEKAIRSVPAKAQRRFLG